MLSEILLDIHNNDSLVDAFTGSGVKVVVHDIQVPPRMNERGISLSPGTEAFISIEKNVIRSLSKPYSDVDCVQDVSDYRYKAGTPFDTYSYEGCMVDCLLENTVVACNCTLTFNDTRSCTLSDFYFCMPDGFQETAQICTYCRDPCEVTRFSTELTSLRLPGPNTHNILPGYTQEYTQNNMIYLHVFYPSLHYTVTEQVEAFTFDELISNLGGQLGLFLGASLMTMVELLEGLALLTCAWYKRKIAKPTSAELKQ